MKQPGMNAFHRLTHGHHRGNTDATTMSSVLTRPFRSITVMAALGCLAFLATPSHATVVFQGTGADFAADPLTTFPTITPLPSGDAVDFVANTPNQILARYPLVTAGTFAGSQGPITIAIETTLTRLSDDFDPVFLVTDGTNAVGGQIGDNPNGSARAIEALLATDSVLLISTPFIFDNASFPSVGLPLDAMIDIVLEPTDSTVHVSFLNGAATAQAFALDRTADLEFLLVANSFVPDGEIYQVNTLTLEILPDIPEPTAAWLVLVYVGAVLVRR